MTVYNPANPGRKTVDLASRLVAGEPAAYTGRHRRAESRSGLVAAAALWAIGAVAALALAVVR